MTPEEAKRITDYTATLFDEPDYTSPEQGVLSNDLQDLIVESLWCEDNANIIQSATSSTDTITLVLSDGRVIELVAHVVDRIS